MAQGIDLQLSPCLQTEPSNTLARLQHATIKGGCETCDPTTPLGGWSNGNLRCFNGPQQWALRWARDLNGGNAVNALSGLTVNRERAFTLPDGGLTGNVLRVM